ncbi:MAG: hypothetical protein RLZZ196_2687 [Bacteroidota bacterium]|jgi:hypothetical protein
MSAEMTTVVISNQDITQINISNTSVTSINSGTADTTILVAAPATINGATLSLSNANPVDVARVANSGISNLVSRADHTHSAANLLLDGGNY